MKCHYCENEGTHKVSGTLRCETHGSRIPLAPQEPAAEQAYYDPAHHAAVIAQLQRENAELRDRIKRYDNDEIAMAEELAMLRDQLEDARSNYFRMEDERNEWRLRAERAEAKIKLNTAIDRNMEAMGEPSVWLKKLPRQPFFVRKPVVCDCGAAKAKTTHANWCGILSGDWE